MKKCQKSDRVGEHSTPRIRYGVQDKGMGTFHGPIVLQHVLQISGPSTTPSLCSVYLLTPRIEQARRMQWRLSKMVQVEGQGMQASQGPRPQALEEDALCSPEAFEWW